MKDLRAIVIIKAKDIKEKKGHYGCLASQIEKIISVFDKTDWKKECHNSWTLPNGNYFSVDCAVNHFICNPNSDYRDKPFLPW